ncbi:MAG TPA: hypothetical protein VK510_03185 [Solirubrobacteraceae bacterium]|nr:hypothetical protein [Solirubrobacteraceae bacterium]
MITEAARTDRKGAWSTRYLCARHNAGRPLKAEFDLREQLDEIRLGRVAWELLHLVTLAALFGRVLVGPHRDFAELVGCSERQAGGQMRRLAELGLVQIRRSYVPCWGAKSGRRHAQRSNSYVIGPLMRAWFDAFRRSLPWSILEKLPAKGDRDFHFSGSFGPDRLRAREAQTRTIDTEQSTPSAEPTTSRREPVPLAGAGASSTAHPEALRVDSAEPPGPLSADEARAGFRSILGALVELPAALPKRRAVVEVPELPESAVRFVAARMRADELERRRLDLDLALVARRRRGEADAFFPGEQLPIPRAVGHANACRCRECWLWRVGQRVLARLHEAPREAAAAVVSPSAPEAPQSEVVDGGNQEKQGAGGASGEAHGVRAVPDAVLGAPIWAASSVLRAAVQGGAPQGDAEQSGASPARVAAGVHSVPSGSDSVGAAGGSAGALPELLEHARGRGRAVRPRAPRGGR